MDWLVGLKDLGFPAIFSLALLYVLTTRIESFHRSIDELRDEVRHMHQDIQEAHEYDLGRDAGRRDRGDDPTRPWPPLPPSKE